MKNLNKYFLLLISLALFISACDDMLEEVPTKQKDIIPTSVEYLDGFFSDLYFNEVKMQPFIAMSDDYVPLATLQERSSWAYSDRDLQLPIAWDMNLMVNSGYDKGPWGDMYSNIYEANTILDYLPEVSGSVEQKIQTRGDAHLWRAFSYFNLVKTYCLPYKWDGSNGTELGLPLKKTTSLEEFIERSTLQETYDFILEDLQEAEALLANTPLEVGTIGRIKQWRGSAPAVYSVYAQVYLAMGNFDMALEYAQKAIDNKGAVDFVDFNVGMEYADNATSITVNIEETQGVVTQEQILLPKTQSPEFNKYDWTEVFYYASTDFGTWFTPSQSLIDTYGTDDTERMYDLRWKYFYVENYSYRDYAYRGGTDWRGTFTPSEKVGAFTPISVIGPSIAEMKLIVAECQARNNNISGAQSTLNELRAKRFDTNAPANIVELTLTDKDNAIMSILAERRREMPFYTRWFDLGRISSNGESQYVPETISRNFFEYDSNTVDGSSPAIYSFSPVNDYLKFAFPLPKGDIDQVAVYGVELEQNKY
jgi:tetratricopeptide (TPR) repeat protein